jgi:WD40 repeat protein
MSTLPDGEAAALSPSQVLQVDEVCLRFEAVWKAAAGKRPRLEQYLGDAPPPARRKLLYELLALELAYRRREGELPAPEEYAPRFPDDLPTIRAVFAEVLPPSPGMIPVNQDARVKATLLPRPLGDGHTLSAAVAIPGYEVLAELGRGGMGVVYQARQVRANRVVALKMILTGVHAGEAERRRFLTEAEAVARVQHPNIVQVHEVGEHDGHPFFSLEFCPGGSLADKLDGTPLPPHEAARLVEVLARAVQAAHEAGVVHRDLKPANVLLAADGTPKVTDFGLAKRLGDAAGQTASGAIVGTPSYMAPEQAAGRSKEVGALADVYALGAVLYECLTGRPPFKAATPLDTLLQVLGEEPAPPRQLQPKTPADLETICLKCLQKERSKRYATAAALAEDLRRFQAGEAIAARPVTAAERGWKWVRRNPVVAPLAAAVAAALVLGAGAAAVFGVKAESRAREATIARNEADENARQATAAKEEATRKAADERRAHEDAVKALRTADEARRRAEWLTYAGQLVLAQREWQDNEVSHARALLDACQPDLRGWEHAYLRHLFDRLNQQTLKEHTGWVKSVCWSPDGRRLASAAMVGGKVWDTRTWQELLSLKGHTGRIFSVCFSPDGRRLASAALDGTVKVWDAQTGQETLSLKWHTGEFRSVCWSPDGKRLAGAGCSYDENELSVGKPELKVWDAQTGRETLSLKGAYGCVCFSPDGRRLAGASGGIDTQGKPLPGQVKVWDAQTGQEARTLQGHTGDVYGVCFSPDGKRLASASEDGTVKVWDAQTGQEARTLQGHTGDVYGVCWSPDGKRLASAGGDGTVKVWDAAKGQEVRTFKGHTGAVNGVCWSPDGRLASASEDWTVKIWDAAKGQEALSLQGRAGRVHSVCWNPDGQRLASASEDDHGWTVKVWDAAKGQEARTLKGHAVCWSPDGKRLATAEHLPDPAVEVWDAANGQKVLSIKGGGGCVCFSPDGRLASDSQDGTVKVWDAQTGEELHTLQRHGWTVCSMCFSPDARRLAIALCFMPDGRRLASTTRVVEVWDAERGQEALPLKGHTGAVNSVCWSPDGRRLASASWDQTVKVWDAATGQEVLSLKGHTGAVYGVCWSPDGRRLASAGDDRTVRIWDAVRGQEALSLKGHTGAVRSVCWSPDGRRLASAGDDSTVRIWDGP